MPYRSAMSPKRYKKIYENIPLFFPGGGGIRFCTCIWNPLLFNNPFPKKIILIFLFGLDKRCVIENSKQIGKNFKKIKKYRCGFISSENRLEKNEKERENKNYPSVPFLPEA